MFGRRSRGRVCGRRRRSLFLPQLLLLRSMSLHHLLRLLLVPLLFIACICIRVDPFPAIGALFQILGALRGTHVEVVNESVSVLVNIF